MFERYTEKARRVIFFARFEASQCGSPFVHTDHLLLAILREDKSLTNRFLRSHASIESIRRQIAEHTTVLEAVSTSVDLPLSEECGRVLTSATEEAEALSHKYVGTEHLLLGLLREESSFATRLLAECGVRLLTVREELKNNPHPFLPRGALEPTALSQWFRDLISGADENHPDPIIGRDREIAGVVEILCCRDKKNALLVGRRGAGKAAIVEGLAQRVAHGKMPSCLAGHRILALKPGALLSWPRDRQRLDDLMTNLTRETRPAETIVFVDELQAYTEAADILRRLLFQAGVQCIASIHSSGEGGGQASAWLQNWFQTIYVRPLEGAQALAVVMAHKASLETFHGVTYTEETVKYALDAAAGYLPESALPGKAVDLLDAAGSHRKMRQPHLPRVVAEAETRLHLMSQRAENAIANHEFEKARFYSEEERKQKSNLASLREKYKVDDLTGAAVSCDDLQEVIARWGASSGQ